MIVAKTMDKYRMSLLTHDFALSYACLRSNRLGGGLTLRATHVTCEINDIRPNAPQLWKD
jgi:hypothetical protein